MTKFLIALAVATQVITAAALQAANRHVSAALTEIDDSGVSGRVELTQMPRSGTLVTVKADGLEPGTAYVSLCYDNQVCDVEPYNEANVIGRFTANSIGMVTVTRKMPANLERIGSISVRRLKDADLKACASIPR